MIAELEIAVFGDHIGANGIVQLMQKINECVREINALQSKAEQRSANAVSRAIAELRESLEWYRNSPPI
jgi:hypothetical protein